MDANGPSQGKKKALNRNRRATYCLGKIRLYLGKLGIEGNSVLCGNGDLKFEYFTFGWFIGNQNA